MIVYVLAHFVREIYTTYYQNISRFRVKFRMFVDTLKNIKTYTITNTGIQEDSYIANIVKVILLVDTLKNTNTGKHT